MNSLCLLTCIHVNRVRRSSPTPTIPKRMGALFVRALLALMRLTVSGAIDHSVRVRPFDGVSMLKAVKMPACCSLVLASVACSCADSHVSHVPGDFTFCHLNCFNDINFSIIHSCISNVNNNGIYATHHWTPHRPCTPHAQVLGSLHFNTDKDNSLFQ